MATKHIHKRPSVWRRLKHKIRRNRWIVYAVFISVIIVIIGALPIVFDLRNQEAMHIASVDNNYVGIRYLEVVWKGQKYKYNNQLTTILLAGVDSEGDMKELKTYTIAPNADSVQVLVIDPWNHQMHMLALNRDTMTKIHKYTLDGKDRGLFTDHLALAFAYGNGGRASCRNLSEAVSMLLNDVPISDYIVVNRSSLASLAQIIGPVEVTVPNDDLVEKDPAYSKGSKMIIDENNLEFYVRSRDTGERFSNTGRMERQKSYINAAMAQFLDRLEREPSAVWNDLEKIEKSMQTNITRNRYLKLVNALGKVSNYESDYMTLEGEQVEGAFHDEFYVDQEALFETVLNLFYIK